MMSNIFWYLVITAGFVATIVTIGLIWFRFPDRTIHDVADYLLPVDFDKAEALLDPQEEATLRKDLSPAEFRALQRKRIHLYLAIVQRMAHNSAVLIEWANREAETGDRTEAGDGHEITAGRGRGSTLLTSGIGQVALLAPDPAGFVVDLARPKPGRYAASGRGAWIRELRPPQNRCQFPVYGNGAGGL